MRVRFPQAAPLMNLELLIKLVKLANNNPNENEANLAARKVCRIIAEGNYKFNQPALRPNLYPNEKSKPSVRNPYTTPKTSTRTSAEQAIYDRMRQMQEDEMKRRKDSEFNKSRFYYDPTNSNPWPWEDK